MSEVIPTDAAAPPADDASGRELLVAGALRLDVGDERAWLGATPLRLGGKAFVVLARLMRQPQALVTKDELFDSGWPGLAVSESVLTTAVKEIRQALGDDARSPAFIETVHGRGYRFLRPVVRGSPEHAATATAPVRRRRWPHALGALALVLIMAAAAAWIALGPGGLARPHPKSVAVAPFVDLSAGHADQWFADGLTEEVESTLARTADLRVAARLHPGADPLEAARARRAAHVLTGTVRQSGGRVRVTADLIRTADGVHVWSQSYDREAGDIITIQEDVGVHIAQALRTATDPARLRAMSASGAHNVEAYEAYLRGLALDRRQLEEGDVAFARQAAESFERARALDPQFAAAHWRAAKTWFGNATRVDSPAASEGPSQAERLARFFERVDAAIATSPDGPEQLRYRAARALMQLKLREAQGLMERYLAARPRDIEAWSDMAELSAYVGDRHAVAQAARRVEQLSMQAGEPRSRAITLLVHALRFEEAADLGRRMVRARPKAALVLYQAHRAAIYAGRREEARGYLERLKASTLPDQNKQLAALRQACADRRLDAARPLYAALAASPRLSTRVAAAETMGDDAAATRALAPYDAPDLLPTLMQFMVYPSFDARPFPNLRTRLAADGLTPHRPVPDPNRCPPGTVSPA
jgi:TolB-like protein/DNA-binding winged helix-turn-helix (wHTH) protein